MLSFSSFQRSPPPPSKMCKTNAVVLLLLLLLISPSTANIKSLTITSDTRPVILFEKFGFTKTGHVAITVSEVSVSSLQPNPSRLGFFLLSENSLPQVLIEIQQNPSFCVLDSHYITPLFTFQNLSLPFNNTYLITSPDEYSFFFSNCVPGSSVSMSLHTEFFNIDPNGIRNYLSSGQTHLPTLFLFFSVSYFIFLFFWLYYYYYYSSKHSLHRIHNSMTSLLIMNALNLFSAFEVNRYVKVNGTPNGWDVLFYVFHFVQVVVLFTVVVLVGTGWSFLKPYLRERGKKVLIIVIPLQVIANVAFVVIGKSGPITKDWVTWNQVFFLVDLVSCCVIIFLFVWCIRSLRGVRKFAKLSLMRWFYVVVIGYLFFTRFVMFAVKTVVGYEYRWVTNLAEESVSLAFCVVTFCMFRPVQKEESLLVDEEEEKVAGIAVKG